MRKVFPVHGNSLKQKRELVGLDIKPQRVVKVATIQCNNDTFLI